MSISESLSYVVPDAPSRDFARGDVVDVCDREGRTISQMRVKRVGRQVHTEDGRMWTQRGYWYGGKRQIWPFPFIRLSRVSK